VHKRFAGALAERLTAATGRPDFERFTQRARDVLSAAADAAAASGHREIGTGHLLLGLYAGPAGIAAKALLALQVSREQVEDALREAWARATGPQDEPVTQAAEAGAPFGGEDSRYDGPELGPVSAYRRMSPGARTALLDAVAVALEFGHNYIGTEHILLGLYRNPDSLAARVLAGAGADRSQVQVRIAELLRGYA
jgi:ATP-dependent Clp protease ATP-binding subunit ClpA